MANATIKIQFGSDSADALASDHMSAEVDSRATGLNGGKTSFEPGDSVYILAYLSDNLRITAADCSAGTISAAGSTTVSQTQELTFEGVATASLDVPASGSLGAVTWWGRSLGSISLGADKTTCTAGSAGVAVAQVTYPANALIYRLDAPASMGGSTDYSILVLLTAGPA